MVSDFNNIGNYSLPTQNLNFDTSFLGSSDGTDLSGTGGGFNIGNILGLVKNLPIGNVLGKLGNLGIGGMTGYADASSTNNKFNYLPMYNWRGDGLATGGLQMLYNPRHRDYASGGQMLSSLFGNDDGENSNKNSGGFMKDLRQKWSDTSSQPMYSSLVNSGINGLGDYSLPVQQYKYNKFWE